MTLTSAELSAMRSHAGTILLGQTGTIHAMTATRDSIGDSVPTWAAIGTVFCYVESRQRAAANPVDGRIVYGEGWTGYLAYDATVSLGNRLATSGRTFEVIGINDAITWPISKQLQLEERQ